MRSKFVTGLESKRSVRKLWGFLGHLLASADWGAIWPAGDQIPLRQRTIHLQDCFARRIATHKNNGWKVEASGDQTEEMGLHQPVPTEIAEIAPGRALDQIDRKLEQANLPRVIDPLDHRAERLLGPVHSCFCLLDDRGD